MSPNLSTEQKWTKTGPKYVPKIELKRNQMLIKNGVKGDLNWTNNRP